MLRYFLAALAVVIACCGISSESHAQATAIASCGSVTLPVGSSRPLFMDLTGVLCTSGSGGGGGAVTIASGGVASGAYSSGAFASGAFSAGSIAAGAGVDGWDLTQGAKADSVCGTATGTCTQQALLKFIASSVAAAVPAGTNTIGGTTPVASATGGATPFHLVAANTTNSTSVKAGAGTVYGVQLGGIGSVPAYLKFYNTVGAPTCASDTVVKTLIIPAASTAANGGGSNVSVPVGIAFATGIGICVTNGIADNDNVAVAASTFIINIDWK